MASCGARVGRYWSILTFRFPHCSVFLGVGLLGVRAARAGAGFEPAGAALGPVGPGIRHLLEALQAFLDRTEANGQAVGDRRQRRQSSWRATSPRSDTLFPKAFSCSAR